MAGMIDVHTHALPREIGTLIASGEGPASVAIRHRADGLMELRHDNGLTYPIPDAFSDLDAKLEQMDRDGIAISVVSTSPSLFLYWLDPRETADFCTIFNDSLARMARGSGGRIKALAMLPMNDPPAADAELRRIWGQEEVVGAAIGTSVGSLQLDSPELDSFFSTVEELSVPLMLHPYLQLVTEPGPGLRGFHLGNVVSSPVETLIAASRLIVGGVLDRHPGLSLLLTHGGGGLPFHLGRLSHAYADQEATRAVAKRPPDEYLDNFLFDSIVFDRRVLRFIVDLVGPDRVMFGTNVPLAMASVRPEDIRETLPAAVAEMVLAGNASQFFGLPAPIPA